MVVVSVGIVTTTGVGVTSAKAIFSFVYSEANRVIPSYSMHAELGNLQHNSANTNTRPENLPAEVGQTEKYDTRKIKRKSK